MTFKICGIIGLLGSGLAVGQTFPPPAGGGGGGSGTATSVGLSMPAALCSVTNSPVTTTGTLTCTFATGQTANMIFGSDGSGNVGLMNLTAAQVPTLASTKISGLGTASLQNANTLSLQGGYLSNTYTVGTGGVTAGHLVQFDSTSKAIAATAGYGGIAASTVSAAGSVEVQRLGIASCVFENTAVIGDIAIPGTSDHTECRDSGLTSSTAVPGTTPVIGLIQSAAAAGSSANVRLHGVGVFGTQVPASQITGLPACNDAGGSHLNYNATTATFSCGTSVGSFPSGYLSWSAGAITTGSCSSNTFTLLNAVPGDTLAVGAPILTSPLMSVTMLVSATDTAQVTVCNFSGSTQTLGLLTYKAKDIQ